MNQDSIVIFVTEPTIMAMETPWADEKSLVVGSAASYDAANPWIISDHPAVRFEKPLLRVTILIESLNIIINTEPKNLPADDINQTGHLQSLTNHDYMEKIMEVNDKLDMVKDIVRPGCSHEVLNTALRYMSLLAATLSTTPQKVRASL